MENKIEELKFVADLAHNGGVMQAQNEALQAEIKRHQAEIDYLRARCAELEAANQQNNQQPKVVVNQFYVLSWPKTVDYVTRLDNDGRRFVGHFMHQTMPEGTPLSVMNQVDEMTRLSDDSKNRLADAIEKVAERPTTQVTAQNYNAHVDEQNNRFPMPTLPIATPNMLEDERES